MLLLHPAAALLVAVAVRAAASAPAAEAPASRVPPPPVPPTRSGDMRVSFVSHTGEYELLVAGHPPVRSAPLSLFVNGADHTVANGGLRCGAVTATRGADGHGDFAGAELNCTAAGSVPATFSWRAYTSAPVGSTEGKILAILTLPEGAKATTAAGAFELSRQAPKQFAPFPAWRVEGALNTSALLCYGGDKSHLYSAHAVSAGGGGLADKHVNPSCFALGNGPATLLWAGGGSSPSPGLNALVAGPADAFHLNYNTRSTDSSTPSRMQAKLWYNAGRGDVSLCLSTNCDTTQKNSGYVILSADEGSVSTSGGGEMTQLFFSWSQTNQDNWVTNSSRCPGPSYKNCGNNDGSVYSNSGNMGNKGRIELKTYVNANGTHHMAAATEHSQAWALAHGYTQSGSLGWVDRPSSGPPPAICQPHAGVDYVCCDLKQVNNVSSVAECCAKCKAEPKCTAWKFNPEDPSSICFLKQGELSNPVHCPSCVVGYTEAPQHLPAANDQNNVWSFGVSGDVLSVPPGFTQSTLLVYSAAGPTRAWDVWGSSMRAAYETTKLADQDIFLAALTMWTDNGAATLGAAWSKVTKGTAPPAYTHTEAPGGVVPPDVSFMNWNWSMVSTEVYGKVADSVVATGIAPRATQLDCWWYPVQVAGKSPASSHPFWCVSDWVLPEQFYPNGTGGLRQRQGVPLMLYFPALCVENVFNAAGKYTWSNTADTGGFVVPVSNQSEEFWGDMFDYGAALASKSVDPSSKPWPNVWAPPAVEAGWQGTNLAAYETDFYHNIVSETPEMRQVFGAGEAFLNGINLACLKRNMTAQLCAGNPPSFLEALTMPAITNARASIDYDWDGDPVHNTGPRSNNGAHNWAAPDNGWVFWATRIAPSKDNFWTSFRDLYVDGGGQDSGRNGKDAELHAINALLLTGPVGLGDTCIGNECMVNKTLLRRLARADGILLRPDRPMAPIDAMFGGLLGGVDARSMPGLCTIAQETQPSAENARCGARLWQTHATVYPEDPTKAPELATAPTRRLVSHTGVDATEQKALPEALMESKGRHLLQHLVVSVDQPESFKLQALDLYPLPPPTTQIFWRKANDGGAACTAGSDAVASGCVSGHATVMTATTELFDVTTASFRCSQPPYAGGILPAGPNCLHAVGVWQVWTAEADAQFVLLGDLTAYVSLSGYRFRLPATSNTGGGAHAVAPPRSQASPPLPRSEVVGEQLVVVGMPKEEVTVTYLRKVDGEAKWTVAVKAVEIGADGRAEATLH